jgi:hypothetical protein
MPIGDKEAAAIDLERVLNPRRDGEWSCGGFCKAKAPMSAITVNVFGPSTRLDRAVTAREAIDKHGATYLDRFGAPRAQR